MRKVQGPKCIRGPAMVCTTFEGGDRALEREWWQGRSGPAVERSLDLVVLCQLEGGEQTRRSAIAGIEEAMDANWAHFLRPNTR